MEWLFGKWKEEKIIMSFLTRWLYFFIFLRPTCHLTVTLSMSETVSIPRDGWDSWTYFKTNELKTGSRTQVTVKPPQTAGAIFNDLKPWFLILNLMYMFKIPQLLEKYVIFIIHIRVFLSYFSHCSALWTLQWFNEEEMVIIQTIVDTLIFIILGIINDFNKFNACMDNKIFPWKPFYSTAWIAIVIHLIKCLGSPANISRGILTVFNSNSFCKYLSLWGDITAPHGKTMFW